MVYRIDGNLLKQECTFAYDGFLSGHEGDILCMDYNGHELVGTGSDDHTVRLWSGIKREKRGLYMVQQIIYDMVWSN